MKTKTFSPILAPNQEANLDKIKYPILASYKLDGIRCLFYKGQILSRSLKPIQNKQLKEKFEPLRKYSENNNCILDGEIYSPTLTFQEITSFVMTQDFEDKKTVKKYGEVLTIPDHLKFYCFDSVREEKYEEEFYVRCLKTQLITDNFPLLSVFVKQIDLYNKKEVKDYFRKALKDSFEGLILRDPNGRYKFGRGTLNEGLIYKVKPFRAFDAKITGVVQATKVVPNAEKTINELGRSVTSKKKDDRVLIEKASAFNVLYEGKELKVTLAMTDEEKEVVWKNRGEFIGRTIEYKGLCIGMKDVPRHPVMLRFRKDKDD